MAYHNIDNTPSARVYTDTSQTLMGLGGGFNVDPGDFAQAQAHIENMTGVTATTMPISTDLFRLGAGARAPIAPTRLADLSPAIAKLIAPKPIPTGSTPPKIGGSQLSLPPGSRGPAKVGGSQMSLPPGYRLPPTDTTPTTDTARDSTSTGEWLSPLLTIGVFVAGIAVLLYKK